MVISNANKSEKINSKKHSQNADISTTSATHTHAHAHTEQTTVVWAKLYVVDTY